MLNTTEAFVLIDCMAHRAGKEDIQRKVKNALDSQSTGSPALVQVNGHPYKHVYDEAAPGAEGFTFKNDVADPCFVKLHQPRWKILVEKCIYGSELSWSVHNYFVTETKRANFSWVPAVFFDGKYDDMASHDTTLLAHMN